MTSKSPWNSKLVKLNMVCFNFPVKAEASTTPSAVVPFADLAQIKAVLFTKKVADKEKIYAENRIINE